MEDGDEGAAAAESALGLNPQLFVDEVHGIVAEISAGAFEHCLQAAAAPGVVGATKAAEKATDLQRGLNAIHNVIRDRLDKRIANWEKFCLWHCFDVPKGFLATEDVDMMKKKRTEMTCLVDNKRQTLDQSFTARAEDIQEVFSILQNM